MIVKKRVIKKGRNFYFDKLLKIYFFSTVTIASLIILFFLNTGYWNQIKDPFLERLHKSSVIHYLKIFEIGTNSIKGFFYKIPELNINISFENLIKIENDRTKVLETAGGSGGAYDFLEVPVKLEVLILEGINPANTLKKFIVRELV